MSTVEQIYQAILKGDMPQTEALTTEALATNLSPETILKEGLISAMQEVGDRFEKGEYYIPEMLIAARAMKAGVALLKPHLKDEGVEAEGKVVIGTVKGDLHDIGKNLVGMMFEGGGFEVIDLGTNVSADHFVQAVKDNQPDVVGLSALLTTTMVNMKSIVQAMVEAGVRDSVKVIIGGAPVTDAYAREIGADGYGPDASRAVRLAKSLMV